MDLKETYIETLKSGIGLDMHEDISCYPTPDGFFLVEYWVHEQNYENLGLTERQLKLLKEDDELLEVFDNPEEAVDFFLKLRPKGKLSYKVYENGEKSNGKLAETLVVRKKSRYFD